MIRCSLFRILFICLFAIPSGVAADRRLKEVLFEDCTEAHKIWNGLRHEEQLESVQYLADVVKLNTTVPNFPGAFYVPPGAQKSRDLAPGALWQAVDAKRELEAKRCALEILEAAGDTALSVLPALVDTYSKEALSDEVAVGIEEAAFQIAETAHLKNAPVEPIILDKVLGALSTDRSLVAKNIALELRSASLPRIILALGKAPPEEISKLKRFIQELDPLLSESVGILDNLVAAATPDDLQRIVTHLPLSSSASNKETLTEITSRTLESNTQIAKPFAILLGRLCLASKEFTLPKEFGTELVNRPLLPILSLGFMPLPSQRCLLEKIPALAPIVFAYIDSTVEGEIEHGLALMPTALNVISSMHAHTAGDKHNRKGEPSTFRSELFGKVSTIALAQTTPPTSVTRQAAAISVLPFFRDKNGETVKILSKLALAKSPALTSAILTALEGIPAETWSQKLLPLALESLHDTNLRAAAETLLINANASVGPQLDTVLKALLKGAPTAHPEVNKPEGASPEHPSTPNSSQAPNTDDPQLSLARSYIRVIANQKSPSASDLEKIIDAIVVAPLNKDVTQALKTLGKRSKTPIRSALTKASHRSKGILLEALIINGLDSPQDRNEFTSRVIAGSCNELLDVAAGVTKILSELSPTIQSSTTPGPSSKPSDSLKERASQPAAPGTQTPVVSGMVTRVAECLPVAPPHVVRELFQLPLFKNQSSLSLFEPVFLSPECTTQLLTEIQRVFSPQVAPLSDENGDLTRILQTAQREPLLSILALIAEVGASPSVEASISNITKSSNDDSELHSAARWALARINPTIVDTTPLIREKIEIWGNNEAHTPTTGEIAAITGLPAEKTIAQLQVGLRSGYIPIVVGASRVALALGSTASPLVPKLRSLLRDPNPPIRYAAAVALLAIDPSGEDEADTVRRLLINRFFPRAHQLEYVKARVAQVAPSVALDSLGELRSARLRELIGEKLFSHLTIKPTISSISTPTLHTPAAMPTEQPTSPAARYEPIHPPVEPPAPKLP